KPESIRLDRVLVQKIDVPIPLRLSPRSVGEFLSHIRLKALPSQDDDLVDVSAHTGNWGHVEPLADEIEPRPDDRGLEVMGRSDGLLEHSFVEVRLAFRRDEGEEGCRLRRPPRWESRIKGRSKVC